MGRLLALLRGDNYTRGQLADAEVGAGVSGGAVVPHPPKWNQDARSYVDRGAPHSVADSWPPQHWGVTGWRPGGVKVVPVWDQIGVYGDAMLNQYPARWEGLQRNNGREGNMPGWVVPYRSSVPYFQVTTYPQLVPGAQRMGGKPSNPAGVGPLSSRAMRQSVLLAQVQQSGLQALSWAQALKQWGSGS